MAFFQLIGNAQVNLGQIKVGFVADQLALVPGGAVFYLNVRAVQPQHGTADKYIRIFRLAQAQQGVGAQQHIGIQHNVIIHDQYMGNACAIFVGFQDLDHAAGKAAGTAHIGVGHNMHGIAVQLIVIQRLAVIGNKHFQVVVQRAGGVFQNIAAHAGNVAHNERLPAEGADIHADFDGLHILFSGIALISAAAIGGIAAQGLQLKKQHAVSALGKIEAEFLHGIRLHYFFGQHGAHALAVDEMAAAQHNAQLAAQFQPQRKILRGGVAAPFVCADAVKVGIKADAFALLNAQDIPLIAEAGGFHTVIQSVLGAYAHAGPKQLLQQHTVFSFHFLPYHIRQSIQVSGTAL